MEKTADKETLQELDYRTIFVGDDTGLLKKLKFSLRIDKNVISAPSKRKIRNKRTLDQMLQDGEEEKQQVDEEEDDEGKKIRKPKFIEDEGVIRDKADCNLKLLDKFGTQEKDEGIQHLCWSLGSGNNDYISYVRGKSNVVEVFDTQTSNVFLQKSFKDQLGEIRGMGSLGDNIFDLRHILIDTTGKLLISKFSNNDSQTKSKAKKQSTSTSDIELKVKSEQVQFMKQSPFDSNKIVIGSKDSLLQIWDINQATQGSSGKAKGDSKKPIWQAKNVANDELDLAIPMWDTDMCFLGTPNNMVACTAYGEIREYDSREGRRKAIVNTTFLPKGQDAIYLSKIISSLKKPEQHVFVANQEGHICMLDRKMNYKMIKKLVGNKGSVRSIASMVSTVDDQEYLMSAGCDRHIRVFNVNSSLQRETELAHAYLKQKLNCVLLSNNQKL
eukprot:403364316